MSETFEEEQASTNHEHEVLAEAEKKLARLQRKAPYVLVYRRMFKGGEPAYRCYRRTWWGYWRLDGLRSEGGWREYIKLQAALKADKKKYEPIYISEPKA